MIAALGFPTSVTVEPKNKVMNARVGVGWGIEENHLKYIRNESRKISILFNYRQASLTQPN